MLIIVTIIVVAVVVLVLVLSSSLRCAPIYLNVIHIISNCIIISLFFFLQDPYKYTGDTNPVLLAVIMSSNLKKMSEQQKWYCRKGHENEAKFCKQFHALIDLKCSNNV